MENTGLQLSDLKVSNLPELQGWKEKQEQLVSDNPYIEITDNKSYEIACKSRTALLKGRTELEKQDKLIASQLASFRKDVKTETDILIAITLPSEEKQQVEVKRYEGIKEAERLEKERIEQARIDSIKAKIDSIETDCFEIIQSMTFQTVIPDGASIALICKTDFDFEEYEALYHQTLLRIENATTAKIDDLNEREEQRIAREQADEENRKLKEKQDLQSKRLNELMPYVSFIRDVDMAKLDSLTDLEYRTILGEVTALFDVDAKQKKEDQDKLDAENLERENKAKADKEKIFEIRKGRLAEIGYTKFHFDLICYDSDKENESIQDITLNYVKDSDAIAFETLITNAKLAIEKVKEEHERAEQQKAIDLQKSLEDAERLKKENKARVKRLASDKQTLNDFIVNFDYNKGIKIDECLLVNDEAKDFYSLIIKKIEALKKELLTELEKL